MASTPGLKVYCIPDNGGFNIHMHTRRAVMHTQVHKCLLPSEIRERDHIKFYQFYGILCVLCFIGVTIIGYT